MTQKNNDLEIAYYRQWLVDSNSYKTINVF